MLFRANAKMAIYHACSLEKGNAGVLVRVFFFAAVVSCREIIYKKRFLPTCDRTACAVRCSEAKKTPPPTRSGNFRYICALRRCFFRFLDFAALHQRLAPHL